MKLRNAVALARILVAETALAALIFPVGSIQMSKGNRTCGQKSNLGGFGFAADFF